MNIILILLAAVAAEVSITTTANTKNILEKASGKYEGMRNKSPLGRTVLVRRPRRENLWRSFFPISTRTAAMPFRIK